MPIERDDTSLINTSYTIISFSSFCDDYAVTEITSNFLLNRFTIPLHTVPGPTS